MRLTIYQVFVKGTLSEISSWENTMKHSWTEITPFPRPATPSPAMFGFRKYSRTTERRSPGTGLRPGGATQG